MNKRNWLLVGGMLFTWISAASAQTTGISTETVELEGITVIGKGSQVELLEEYPGGEVARGGRVGILGNLDYLDSPFSGTAYTSDLVHKQQAESVGDVLQNDPTVRVAKGFGNFQEVYIMRGFPVFSDDITLNGIYGILPRQFVAAELLERVEVFRGANTFLNGAAPGGSGVGGTINLVPKRAPKEGISQFTIGAEQTSQFNGAADFGKRFGDDEDWGIRFNVVGRDGETAVDNQDRSLGAFTLGTDYAGDRFRFSADLGYQDHRIDDPRPQVTPLGAIPEPPASDINFAQPWTYTDEQQIFGVVRGEYDVTDTVKVWLAGGARNGDESNVLANPDATADGNLSASRFDNTREDDVVSFDTGMEARFTTGSVGHSVVLSASSIGMESKNAYALSDFSAAFSSNLYNPVVAAPPTPDFFVGGTLDNPLVTEKSDNQSIVLADTLSLMDGRLLTTFGLRNQDIETTSYDYDTGEELSNYDSSEVTPALGVVWNATDMLSVYGNYAESLQPGEIAPAVSGDVPIINAGEILDPITAEQVEIGIKFDAGDIGGTISAFTIERPNTIVVDQQFTASGKQESTGLEFTVFGEPAEGLRLIGGLTLVDAELAKTQDGLNRGNSPIGIPEIQASANLEWDIASVPGLTMDGRLVYTGSQYADNENSIELDSWQRVDLGVRYAFDLSGKPVTVRARVNNLFDEDYWASTGGFPGANYLVMGDPRTFLVSASFSF